MNSLIEIIWIKYYREFICNFVKLNNVDKFFIMSILIIKLNCIRY